MRLANLIDKDLIFFKSGITDYHDIYKLMAKGIAKEYKQNEAEVFQAFLERDKLGHTVLPGGLVIPHGRIENLNDVIIAIVKTDKPVAVSDGEADLFFGILTGNVASNLYLKVLSGLARIAAGGMDELKKCNQPAQVLAFFDKQNVKIGEQMKVADLMNKEPVTAHIDETINTVVDRMKTHNFIFLPVVDDENRYLGTIDIIDIMKLAYPDHLLMMNDLEFVGNLRPYEDFTTDEKNHCVKEYYRKNAEKVVFADVNIIEMGFLLVKNHWHHLVVLDRNNKVVGVVSSRTLLNMIIRA